MLVRDWFECSIIILVYQRVPKETPMILLPESSSGLYPSLLFPRPLLSLNGVSYCKKETQLQHQGPSARCFRSPDTSADSSSCDRSSHCDASGPQRTRRSTETPCNGPIQVQSRTPTCTRKGHITRLAVSRGGVQFSTHISNVRLCTANDISQ